MASFSGSELLSLWERGQRLHPLDQGLLALESFASDATYDVLAALPFGQRNRRLLELQASYFGSAMKGVVDCPGCGERLELALDAGQLTADGLSTDPVSFAGRCFRLPNSRDLAEAARERDPELLALRLLELCQESGAAPLELSPTEIEEAGELLAAADPLAEIRLDLACATCAHAWHETLDPAMFLWTEIEVRARRLLRDVHALASAYHWSEAAILSLSDRRRAAYLELIDA